MGLFTPDEIEQDIKGTGGIPVSIGASSTWGLRRIVDELLHADDPASGVIGEIETVLVATEKLAGIAQGAAITVDGGARVIRDHRREDDGGKTRIFLGTP